MSSKSVGSSRSVGSSQFNVVPSSQSVVSSQFNVVSKSVADSKSVATPKSVVVPKSVVARRPLGVSKAAAAIGRLARTPLAQRMLQDMQLVGFGERTQETYLRTAPPSRFTTAPSPVGNRRPAIRFALCAAGDCWGELSRFSRFRQRAISSATRVHTPLM